MMNEKAQYRRDPSALTGGHSPAALLRAFLRTTSEQILPLTTSGVRSGSKVFGAAVLKKKDLEAVTVATNQEGKGGPLRHGEVEAVEGFYALEEGERPEVKDTVFFATHEPCSLCAFTFRVSTSEVKSEALPRGRGTGLTTFSVLPPRQ